MTCEIVFRTQDRMTAVIRNDDGTPLDRFDMLKGLDGKWWAWTLDTISEGKRMLRRKLTAAYN